MVGTNWEDVATETASVAPAWGCPMVGTNWDTASESSRARLLARVVLSTREEEASDTEEAVGKDGWIRSEKKLETCDASSLVSVAISEAKSLCDRSSSSSWGGCPDNAVAMALLASAGVVVVWVLES